jgi:hypothetical protein
LNVHAPASPAPAQAAQAHVLPTRADLAVPVALPAHVARCTRPARSRAAQVVVPEVQVAPVHVPASRPAHVPASHRVQASVAHVPAVPAEHRPIPQEHRQLVFVLHVPASAAAVSVTRR